MLMRFSDRYVDSLKPRDKRFAVFEDNARGRGTLGLRVTPKGVKTWVHFYKLDGRKRMTTLGRYPEMTVAEAHAIFGQAGLAVARGQDPAHVAKTERIRRRGALNVADLAEVYLERWARPRKRSWREDERILRHDVLPALGQMKSEDVERRHIVEILDAIVERGAPIVANRTLAVVRKMYRFGIERELVVRNPCEGVSPPAPERRRQRVLGDDELGALLAALPTTTMWTPTQLAMLLLLTTAQRCTEVVTMSWSQVDHASGWWTIPAERAKNGMAHRVPLSAQSAQILELARRHHLGGETLHALEYPVQRFTLQVEHHVTDAKSLERRDVFGNLFRRPREAAAMAVRRTLGLGAEGNTPVRDTHLVRVSACILHTSAEPLHALRQLVRCSQRELGIAGGRIPGFSEPSRSVDCRRAVAAYPDRRVRLPHRLRRERDVRECAELSLKGRVVTGPQLLEDGAPRR